MNKQNFNQLGGFPLETDTLNWLQEAYSIFNALGEVIGNHAIISGCNKVSNNTSSGVVFIDGEIYKFVGGVTQANVRILETSTTKEFENGETNPVHSLRYVTFASGAGSIPWANFKKPDTLLSLSSRILPARTNPQLYTGVVADIPNGWQLCDGTNATPDLRGKFLVGLDPGNVRFNAIGKTGGSEDAVLVHHNHNYKDTYFLSDGTSNNYIDGRENAGAAYYGTGSADENNNWLYYKNRASENEGTTAAGKNLPPFYTLAYIIYTGI